MIDLDIPAPAITLNDVKAAFTHWRKTRTKRDRIPKSLWDQVLSLEDRYSESKVLNTLGISQPQLRKEQARRGQLECSDSSDAVPAFLELTTDALKSKPSAPAASKATFNLELKRQDGAALTIKAFPVSSLKILLNDFYRSW